MAYIDTKYIGECETCRHHKSGKCDTWCDGGESYQPDMTKIPTADVVEVCRCHECKYGDNGIQKQEVYTVCNRFGNGILKMSPLDFCSYGERRTE
jgi:hypothetical protein